MSYDASVFGSKIKQLRLKFGLSQRELATVIDVSPTQISDIEKGKSSPQLKGAYRLAAFFHVSLDSLVGLSEPECDAEFTDKFNSLTDEQRQQVLDYIDFIISRS